MEKTITQKNWESHDLQVYYVYKDVYIQVYYIYNII